MNTKEIFPKKIKLLRVKHDVSQEKLAEMLNFHPKYITKLESEKPTVAFETIDKLSECFNVLPTFFVNPVDVTFDSDEESLRDSIIKKLSEFDIERLKDIQSIIFSLPSKK